MLNKLEESREDLEKVLKLESKNGAAQRELSVVKKYIQEVRGCLTSPHFSSFKVFCLYMYVQTLIPQYCRAASESAFSELV